MVEYIVAIDVTRARFPADAFPADLIRLACPVHDSMSQPSGDEGRFVQGKLFVPPQIRLVGKALSVGVSVAVWSTPLLLSVWASYALRA